MSHTQSNRKYRHFLLTGAAVFSITLTVHCNTANAAELKADALICESDTALLHALGNSRMAALPGSEAIAKSKAQVEFLQPNAQSDATAATMRRVNPDLQRRSEQLEKAALEGAKDVVAKCASSGAESLTVTVLEQRPITGVSRLSLKFRGSVAQLYTASASVRE